MFLPKRSKHFSKRCFLEKPKIRPGDPCMWPELTNTNSQLHLTDTYFLLSSSTLNVPASYITDRQACFSPQ
jgi:hypothetical protein